MPYAVVLGLEPARAQPELDAPAATSASTWATATASGPGRRKVADVTSVPSRIREVSRASPARVTHESVGPGSPGPSPIARKWSERKNASNPHSSAVRATRSRSS